MGFQPSFRPDGIGVDFTTLSENVIQYLQVLNHIIHVWLLKSVVAIANNVAVLAVVVWLVKSENAP